MFTTALLIILEVHTMSPVSQGDLNLVRSEAATSSKINMQSLCCCKRLDGTLSVTFPSTDRCTMKALDGPQASRRILLDFKMVLTPIVSASLGTSEILA